MAPLIIQVSEKGIESIHTDQSVDVIIVDWDRDQAVQPLAFRMQRLPLDRLDPATRLATVPLALEAPPAQRILKLAS